jgi:hypothetical protein
MTLKLLDRLFNPVRNAFRRLRKQALGQVPPLENLVSRIPEARNLWVRFH